MTERMCLKKKKKECICMCKEMTAVQLYLTQHYKSNILSATTTSIKGNIHTNRKFEQDEV